ncbi:MAG TPA: Ulp1 family isopeptidase [Gammaproteobacteria bacterium]|nr:Ulp1 family isopeptidase [Gammaproteobacteria bacterium]
MLSQSQNNINQLELLQIIENSVSENKANFSEERMKIILDVCNEHEIVLNVQQESISQLREIINEATNDLEAFKEKIKAWVSTYKEMEEEAGQLNRSLFATQTRGIYRGLRSDGRFNPQAWCEDLDFEKALATVSAEEITNNGTYIVKPKDLSSSEYLYNTLRVVLDRNLQADIKLLIPVRHAGHWRLAKIDLQQGRVTRAILWDSLNNNALQQHDAFINMQKALNDAQPENAVTVEADARGIQRNGWSCGDYVMQKCCRELDIKNDLTQAAGPEDLREALIQRIRIRIKDEEFADINARLNESNAAENNLKSPTYIAKRNLNTAINSLGLHLFIEDTEMNWTQKKYLMREVNGLVNGLLSGNSEQAEQATIVFAQNTSRYRSSERWKVILGAVIGAAIGFIIGAMLGVMTGPLAAVTAIAAGAQGAIIGASLLTAGGAYAGYKCGFWATSKEAQDLRQDLANINHAAQSIVKTIAPAA